MPWWPDLFSAPALERIRSQGVDARAVEPVPYFAGVESGETEALVGSFAGEPELYHPIRGRVKGRGAFERFVAETNSWMTERHAVIGPVQRIITPRRGIEEMVLTLDGHDGRVELPVAVVADRDDGARIVELRLYYSTWPLTGRHANRPPLLQADPDIHEPADISEYQRALATGDARAAAEAFESDGYVREPTGATHVHRGRDQLVAFHERLFSNGGGIALEHCAVTDNDGACVIEYNLVKWGQTELLPKAGLVVYGRGPSGKLASARIYDDADPPLGSRQ